jgi:hypothetical protein
MVARREFALWSVNLATRRSRVGHDRGVEVPNFVTHYYVPDRGPFLNLSDLADDYRLAVMTELMGKRAQGQQHRLFGKRYALMRHQVETQLRDLFVGRGGHPSRMAPHYFVLGESAWFRGLAPGMKTVMLPVADLPSNGAGITYPDSFTAMGIGPEFGLPHEARPNHGRVILLDELPWLIDTYGLPSSTANADYAGYERRTDEHYVEVQLWSDEPVREFRTDPHGEDV